MLKSKKKIIGVVLVTYFLIELTCYIFIKSGYIKTQLPDFKYEYTLTEYPFEVADIDSVWGTWHYREPFRRMENCLDFDYDINSMGARDKERVFLSKDTNRVFVLGDSFMEGYGLAENDRLSNLLEKNTQREFLNFSCSDFGTTQEWLLYNKLGKQFNHSTLLIGILPLNDFEDNDTSIHVNPYYKRFRPYFKGVYPDYKLVYDQDSIQKATFNKAGFFKKENSFRAKIVRFFRAFTYWFNIVTYVKDYPVTSKYKPASGYYDYSRENLGKICFILEKIKQQAIGKRIIVVTIPVAEDIKRFRKVGKPSLHDSMDSFCRRNNMEYVDLLPHMAGIPQAEKLFFFDCDFHWNREGNKFAAGILQPLFSR